MATADGFVVGIGLGIGPRSQILKKYTCVTNLHPPHTLDVLLDTNEVGVGNRNWHAQLMFKQ